MPELKSLHPPRDISLDVAKGIGILLVISCHSGFPLIAGIRPESFFMPLFFFISGCFASFKVPFIVGIRNKAIQLLLPFFIYQLIFALVTALVHNSGNIILLQNFIFDYELSDIFSFKTLFIMPFLGFPLGLNAACWFIITLFYIFILFFLFRPLFVWLFKTTARQMFTLILMVILFYSSLFFPSSFPFSEGKNLSLKILILSQVGVAIGGLAFFILGKLWYIHKKLYVMHYIYILSLIVFLYLHLRFGPVGFATRFNEYRMDRVRWFAFIFHITGIMSLLYFATSNIKYAFINNKGLAWLGQHTYHIMALHLSGFLLANVSLAAVNSKKKLSQLPEMVWSNFYVDRYWFSFLFSLIFCIICIKIISSVKHHFQLFIQKRKEKCTKVIACPISQDQ